MLPLLLLLTASPTRVAVFDIKALSGFSVDQRDVLSEFLQGELRKRGLSVVSRADIEAVLGLEKMKDALACDQASCLAEIGGALGVQEIVTGQTAHVGSYVTLTLKRLDARTSTVKQQTLKKVDREQALLDALPAIVSELYPEISGPTETRESYVLTAEASRLQIGGAVTMITGGGFLVIGSLLAGLAYNDIDVANNGSDTDMDKVVAWTIFGAGALLTAVIGASIYGVGAKKKLHAESLRFGIAPSPRGVTLGIGGAF